MNIIGIVTLGDDVYRALGETWMDCTVTGNAVNLGADLWQGGRVSAVGTEGKASASITQPDGQGFSTMQDATATYSIGSRVVVIEGTMHQRPWGASTTKLPFRMAIQYTRTDPDPRSYEELLGGQSDDIDRDWLDAEGNPLPDSPNP
ncbi:Uncharacterised protein [Mycobacteroides abscessus subsp. abscessus]|uniref:hypothetical protein n=1 Tax=Mycobacteroides abscessus TaxID=36809 RepID=UPI0009A64391|nr:hypothetical protein [Mycobacteroides abscessus]SKR40503.1 Uncharacterised protein [Mycobacteroides abscessus subsp. abscessus]